MNVVVRTSIFDAWLSKLKDARGKARIIERIRSAERGHFGDCAFVGGGVTEMRIHFGPGYRVYFSRRDEVIYVLLCAGTKHRQQSEISRAQKLVRLLEEE